MLTDGPFANGYYVTPTIVEGLPEDHELMCEEQFLPFLCAQTFTDLDDTMARANNTKYGLTAGFFSEDDDEVAWFLDNIQAGTTYTNKTQATTGAWPGIQAFGGWKGNGSTGKAIGSFYTMPLYMHEQSRTVIG
ncbi:MAG: aldehyde dehydrogenase family protein [Caldilineaceae bacterium]